MGLNVWFQEDVARILGSVDQTMVATQAAIPALDPEKAEAYQQGLPRCDSCGGGGLWGDGAGDVGWQRAPTGGEYGGHPTPAR